MASALEAERELGELAQSFPYLAEVVVGHVAKAGYEFDAAFADGLELILDALERRRVASGADRAEAGLLTRESGPSGVPGAAPGDP